MGYGIGLPAQPVGLPEQKAFLRRLESGACSHAFIVEGPKGSGKLDFALWCTGALLCTGGTAGGFRPCGHCEACRKVWAGFHPDVHLYGDGEKAVSVGDVRALIRETGLVPSDGERSIYLLCHGERMLPSAQNALLKVFEEPPPGVVLFLLTESRRALLPTVRSRGQVMVLSGLSDKELELRLRTTYPRASEGEIASAVRVSQGNLGEASDFLKKEAVQNREKAKEWLTVLFEGDKYRLLGLLAVPKTKRDALLPVVDVLLRLLTDLLLIKTGGETVLLSEQEAGALAAKATRRSLAVMCERAIVCRERLEANGNVTAVMTCLATDLWEAVNGSAERG